MQPKRRPAEEAGISKHEELQRGDAKASPAKGRVPQGSFQRDIPGRYMTPSRK